MNAHEAPPTPTEPHEALLVRLHRALGPLAGGMILDFVDLATFGPVGLFGGFLIGAAVGWWVSSIYGFTTQARILFATFAAIYTAIPFTELLPLATIISAIARFRPQYPPTTAPQTADMPPLDPRRDE
jgi:hypothetical protein